MIELNKMSAIEAKLDAIMNRMNNQERRGHSIHEVGIVEGVEQKNVTDQGLAPSNNNLPTYYTPALRNHENLSYGGKM